MELGSVVICVSGTRVQMLKRLLLSQTITEIIIVIPPVGISLLTVCKVIVLLYPKLYSKHFSVCKVLTL